MKIMFSTLGLLGVIGIGWLSWSSSELPETDYRPLLEEKIRGFAWEGTDSVGAKEVNTIQPYHVNWITQTPFGWQPGVDDPNLAFNSRRGYWGERDAGIARTTQLARDIGVKTMLKPHLWMRRNAGGWRSDIEMKTETDWKLWFENYSNFMLHYARLAEEQQIEALCIGTELYRTAVTREQDWRNLIDEIRKVYSGKLTYAANFYKEYEEIQFWDALDMIGIQAYFPLTNAKEPKIKDLMKGWEPHYRRIKKIQQKWNKPVIFTEIGYRSMKNAAEKPWEWPDGMEYSDEDVSPEVQALCYEAFFRTFWKEEWMEGVFLWIWSRHKYRSDYEPRRQRHRDIAVIDFSPKEEGLKVLEEWFEK